MVQKKYKLIIAITLILPGTIQTMNNDQKKYKTLFFGIPSTKNRNEEVIIEKKIQLDTGDCTATITLSSQKTNDDCWKISGPIASFRNPKLWSWVAKQHRNNGGTSLTEAIKNITLYHLYDNEDLEKDNLVLKAIEDAKKRKQEKLEEASTDSFFSSLFSLVEFKDSVLGSLLEFKDDISSSFFGLAGSKNPK